MTHANLPSLTPYVPPTKKDCNILFQLLFDEYLNPPPCVASLDPVVIAPKHVDSTSPPSLTTIDQDAPSLKALKESCWIKAMQEELNEFKRLKVWELVPRPDRVMIITLKWILKVKLDKLVDQDNPSHGYKLKKALYGLKQALRACPRGIFLNQSKYALEIIKNYDMETSHPVDTPMVEKSKLDAEIKEKVDPTRYRGMIGSLMYLTSSRPNIVFAVWMCSRYQAKPIKNHLHAVKQIFRYLKGTINMGLWHSKDSCIALTAFADVDHAGCQDTRRSTSRSMQLLGDKLKALNLLTKGLLVRGEAMEVFKRRRSMLDYRIQKLSKGLSEGSGIILVVPDETKDNFGSSSSLIFRSDGEFQDISSDEENKTDENKVDAESMVDVTIHQKDLTVQRTALIDSVISMVTEKTTTTLTPLTIQAQVTNVSESELSSKFKQRLLELENKVQAMPKRAWKMKDHKRMDVMFSTSGIRDWGETLILGEFPTITFHTYCPNSQKKMDHQYPTVAKIPVLVTEKFEQWQFRIQQYLQHEHYALWEVIEFGDSYKIPENSDSVDSRTKDGRTVTVTIDDMQKKNDVGKDYFTSISS
nr:retrovirus-related Pol polyprotein from transposon TNT 1-94 [Tanacetum cinerariifolium]